MDTAQPIIVLPYVQPKTDDRYKAWTARPIGLAYGEGGYRKMPTTQDE